MFDIVELYFVNDFLGIGQCLGHIGKHFVHLFLRLEPLLLGVEHAFGVVEVFACSKAQEVVVGLGVILVDKV